MPTYNPPTFVAAYNSSYTVSTSPKTLSVTTQAGDVLVVYAAMENGVQVGFSANNPSGNGVSFTQQQMVHLDGDWADAGIWSGTDATGGTGWTLSLSATAAPNLWGFSCLVFRSSDGIGASTKTNTSGSGSASVNLTSTLANSAMVVCSCDWDISSGSTRTWKTVNSITPSNGNGLETTFINNVQYLVYGAYYTDVGAIGSKTVGYDTGLSQKYSMVALEVKGTLAQDPAMPLMWMGM